MNRLATFFCYIPLAMAASANCLTAIAYQEPAATTAQPGATTAEPAAANPPGSATAPASDSAKAQPDPLEPIHIMQRLQVLMKQIEEFKAQGKQDEVERCQKEMQPLINRLSTFKDNTPPLNDRPKRSEEKSIFEDWSYLMIPIAIVLVLVLSVVLMGLKIHGGRNVMREYFAENKIAAEVIGGWMPPLRLWLNNRRGDQWCRFRNKDGHIQWARIRYPLLGKRKIDFFD